MSLLALRRPTLAEVAKALLGSGVAVMGGAVEAWAGPLLGSEREAVERAAEVRRAEFASGRGAARAALASLGLPPQPLPRRPDGPPLWPEGTTGSISHGGGHVLAAVARLGPGLAALGIDIEPVAALPPEMAETICGEGEDHARAIEVFGAKEAAYKAQFMLTGRMLDFGAMRVSLLRASRFRATLTAPLGPWPKGHAFEGRQARAGALLISAVRLA